MEDIICDISALRLYCTPPAVLGLFEPLPITRERGVRHSFVNLPLTNYVLGTPIHFLVNSQASRTSTKNIKQHLWSGDYPQGVIREFDSMSITSPEMTLLTLARSMSAVQLALCMYELCGEFCVYKLTPEVQDLVAKNNTDCLNVMAGWRCVRDFNGKLTNLWNRPTVLSLDRLKEFAELNRGAYGGKNYYQAASMVAGVTRSPLEAEAALLLSLPRKLGGYGFTLETNKVIPLSPQAKKIYQHEYCVADLYLESPDGRHIVDIECQGAAVHTGEAAGIADANRTTALETMGISVVLITHADIRNPERMELIAKHIANKLGIKYRAKTPRMAAMETKVRSEFPIDWVELSK